MVELAAGTELGTLDGAAVGWYDDDRLVVQAGRAVRVVDVGSGRVLVVQAGRAVRVVDVGSGRVLAERTPVGPGRELTGVWLAALDGTPPPGAIVL